MRITLEGEEKKKKNSGRKNILIYTLLTNIQQHYINNWLHCRLGMKKII